MKTLLIMFMFIGFVLWGVLGCGGYVATTHTITPSGGIRTVDRKRPFAPHETSQNEDSMTPFKMCVNKMEAGIITPETPPSKKASLLVSIDAYCRCNIEGWKSPSCMVLQNKMGYYAGYGGYSGGMVGGMPLGARYNAGFSLATPMAVTNTSPASAGNADAMTGKDRELIADHEERIEALRAVAEYLYSKDEAPATATTTPATPEKGSQKGNESVSPEDVANPWHEE